MIASALIAQPQKTGHRNSESPIPRNEMIVPPINAKPTNSNALDIQYMIKQINDLMIWYYHEQVSYGDHVLYVDRNSYCIY